MNAILSAKRMTWVKFDLRFVCAIPPDAKTGKKRLILQSASVARPETSRRFSNVASPNLIIAKA